MNHYIYLTHYIDESTPLYGGTKNITIQKDSRISKGKSSNTKKLILPNHIGTHIDFPFHFSDEGKTINDYPADFWIFNYPYIVEYSASLNEIIMFESELEQIPKQTDFLIIKTDFQRFRSQEEYWKYNPGLAPKLAKALKEQCRDLKVVGFDFISVTSFQNKEIGRIAHRSFLIENDILAIEDMDLSNLSGTLNKIVCLPLLINEIDGSPITIIGELKNISNMPCTI